MQDFLGEIRRIRKMGSIEDMLKMIPGASRMMPKGASVDPKQMGRVEAIICSMTPSERARPQLLDGSRRKRIAKGSGTTVQDVNQLLRQFEDMKKMMKMMGKMQNRRKARGSDSRAAEVTHVSVKLRMKRMGTKKRPFYRIVATDSRNRRDGRFLEELGYYDPLTTPPNIKLDEEGIFKWLKNGAIPSTNVEGLMRRMGTLKKWQFVKAAFPPTRSTRRSRHSATRRPRDSPPMSAVASSSRRRCPRRRLPPRAHPPRRAHSTSD
jgi:ribosomal protein S16